MGSMENMDTFSNLKKRMEAARVRPLGFRMLKPRTRWHVLLRRFLQLKNWLSYVEVEMPDTGFQTLRRRKAGTGEMSPEEKALLRRPVWERTDEEKETLSKLFSGLKCFRRYPEHVRRQLASFVSLEAYEANRVIVRQGHQPQGMYFVSSGQLDMWRTTRDPVLGDETVLLGTIGPGDIFGSLALLRNEPRSRTIISKTIVELLLLRKHDFDTVLKATIMKEWSQIKSALAEIPHFYDWPEKDIQDICTQSKLLSFSDGETILGDGFGVANMSYFIIEGKAVILQHLILVRKNTTDDRPSKWGPQVKCMPPGTKIEPPVGECVFMLVANLDKGACFSMGEDLQDRRVVAEGFVRIMLIPLFSLTSRNRGYRWTRMREFLDRRLPPQRQLFLTMLNGRDWMAYRKEIRKSLPGRPGNTTSIHDVPLSYRAANDVPAMKYSVYTLGRLEHPRKWQWVLERKQKAVQDMKIAAAKLEYRFDKEFLKKFGDQIATKKKKAHSDVDVGAEHKEHDE